MPLQSVANEQNLEIVVDPGLTLYALLNSLLNPPKCREWSKDLLRNLIFVRHCFQIFYLSVFEVTCTEETYMMFKE